MQGATLEEICSGEIFKKLKKQIAQQKKLKEQKMLYIDFCKSPKNVWVGCIEHNGDRVFASGRTMDLLVNNMKAMVMHTWRITSRIVKISSKQMTKEEFEQKHVAHMSSRFKGKFWNEKKNEVKMESIKVKEQSNGKYTYEIKDGVLYVYKKKLVVKYNLENK